MLCWGHYNEFETYFLYPTNKRKLTGYNTKPLSENQHAFALIRNRVYEPLWSRVPTHIARSGVCGLLTHLATLARPFRFLDLPAELRVRVYRFALVGNRSTHRLHGKNNRGPHYAITCVSRQMRKETLPIFFNLTDFAFMVRCTGRSWWDDLKCDIFDAVNREIVPAIRKWTILNGGAEQLRALRKVNLTVCVQVRSEQVGRWCRVEVSYSAKDGLRAKFPDALTEQSRKLLQEHFDAVEQDRKMLGLQGEAIILAMTCNPKLWECGTLTYLW